MKARTAFVAYHFELIWVRHISIIKHQILAIALLTQTDAIIEELNFHGK